MGVLATGRYFAERRKTEFGNTKLARRDTEDDAKILRDINNQQYVRGSLLLRAEIPPIQRIDIRYPETWNFISFLLFLPFLLIVVLFAI